MCMLVSSAKAVRQAERWWKRRETTDIIWCVAIGKLNWTDLQDETWKNFFSNDARSVVNIVGERCCLVELGTLAW